VYEDDGSDLHSHNEVALYVIGKPNFGFAKNDFIDATGKQVFAETSHSPHGLIRALAKAVAFGEEEKARFLVEFDADTISVMNKAAIAGMPLYSI